jgi:hypothetical protein
MNDIDQQNLDNFWAVFGQPEPEPEPAKIFFRLYHDERGRPLFYSMEDLPGKYIELDQETYQRAPAHARVRDGKLIELVTEEIKKLVPSEEGTCCSPQDVCVVVDQSQPHIKWSIKIDETD